MAELPYAEPQSPIPLLAKEQKYYKWNVPAFRRDKPTQDASLWLDTKINFLNEVMKFLPRNVTDTLTNHYEAKDLIGKFADSKKYADSVYNKEVFEDTDNGLWKGLDSQLQNEILGTDANGQIILQTMSGTSTIGAARFTGIMGVPYDGALALGNADGRELSLKNKSSDSRKYVFSYKRKDEKSTDSNASTTNYTGTDAVVVPIIGNLAGQSEAKYFKEGVNFHPTIVDMQHTAASYEGAKGDFIVDMNGDGFADNDTSYNWQPQTFSGNVNLTNTALTVGQYQNDYLYKLGVTSPVVDYSSIYQQFMQGSLFNFSGSNNLYLADDDKITYNKLKSQYTDDQIKAIIDGSNNDFQNFINKVKINLDLNGSTEDYIPNIYEIARSGINVDDTSIWSEKDIFYLSMLMLESRRRYTDAMASVFGVNSKELDINSLIGKYANENIWTKYDSETDQLYAEVKTKDGVERMYNYFIPDEIGADVSDIQSKIYAKTDWLKRRAIEAQSYNAGFELYQQSLQTAFTKNDTQFLNDATGLSYSVFAGTNIGSPYCADLIEKDVTAIQTILSNIKNKGTEIQVGDDILEKLISLSQEVKDISAWFLYNASGTNQYFDIPVNKNQ
ncbi:MAG: hypothetical protein PHV30_10995, partial [Candidatus Margulisbacteria bacterium]|nr:hypothetical protein [Candidatus Margulisiibacteriota bacterium]